jgi:hypothetical protein
MCTGDCSKCGSNGTCVADNTKCTNCKTCTMSGNNGSCEGGCNSCQTCSGSSCVNKCSPSSAPNCYTGACSNGVCLQSQKVSCRTDNDKDGYCVGSAKVQCGTTCSAPMTNSCAATDDCDDTANIYKVYEWCIPVGGTCAQGRKICTYKLSGMDNCEEYDDEMQVATSTCCSQGFCDW